MGAERGEDDRRLSHSLSQELIGLGFDPGIPVYELSNVSFDLELVKQTLFHSPASTPVLLPLVVVEDSDTEAPLEFRRREWPVPMVVETIRVFYPPAVLYANESRALGCLEQPEWYASGYLWKAPLDPNPDRIRVNAYIRSKGSDGPGEIDVVLLQLVRRASEAASAEALVWGEGIPGHD